jgi:hypothetical protein
VEEANMTSTNLFQLHSRLILVALLTGASFLIGQEQAQKTSFYEVTLTKDEVCTYTNLKFKGDYASWESPSGQLVLGKTEAGVTVLVVLGSGTLAIEAADVAQEKFKTVFGGFPLKTAFTSLYMRLHPKEYEEVFAKQSIQPAPDEAALAKAKPIYDSRFLASYHAGPRAILPPYKTRVIEFDTADFGQITTEEGYWVTLRRLSPYGSVYPARFVNPKQK